MSDLRPAPGARRARTTRAAFLKRSVALAAATALGSAWTDLRAPPARAETVSPRDADWRVVDVRDYGARGDGARDDSTAILEAVAAMTPRSVLHFPAGTYRFARRWPPGDAAIALSGLSDIAVEMALGATLLLDNLDASGRGTSHGICVHGACSNVHIAGCTVRWRTRPTARGFGDAFRFLGYPSDSRPPAGWSATTGSIEGIVLSKSAAFDAPQTGAVFMGCASVEIREFTASDTLADGLHLNACRDVMIDGHAAFRTGDDGLAFVTYHDAEHPWLGPQGPFARSALGEWSNSGCTASRVRVRSGGGNGVRVAGCDGVRLEELAASGVAAGIIIDSGRIGPGNKWQYLASRRCAIHRATIEDCDVGILAQVFNASSADDAAWWRVDVDLSHISVARSTRYAVRTEGDGSATSAIAGLRISDLDVTGGGEGAPVSFSSLRDSSVTGLEAAGASIAFFGMDTPLDGSMRGLAASGLVVDRLIATGGGITFQDIRDVRVGRIRSTDAPYTGLGLTRVRDMSIESATIVTPNRRNDALARGVLIAKGQQITIADLDIRHDANDQATWRSLEIGGGDGADVSTDVRLNRVRYTSLLATSGSGVVVQGGPHGPQRCSYLMHVLNAGTANPGWIVEEWPDPSSGPTGSEGLAAGPAHPVSVAPRAGSGRGRRRTRSRAGKRRTRRARIRRPPVRRRRRPPR